MPQIRMEIKKTQDWQRIQAKNRHNSKKRNNLGGLIPGVIFCPSYDKKTQKKEKFLGKRWLSFWIPLHSGWQKNFQN